MSMEIFFFHLMPWPHIPEDFKSRYRSSWVVLPNSCYDPVVGHRVYREYLDQLAAADGLGFDAVCVNEHHQNGYGTMPSPNVIASILCERTKRAKIAILGNGICLRDNPLRVAEEVAMIDVISGGRVISGFVRGIGCEYYSLSLDPTVSRERFYEAHDLIVKAWTEPGPFAWDGEHYQFRYVNVWPRPLQKPHPPIFCPSQGSSETIAWAAARRYPVHLHVHADGADRSLLRPVPRRSIDEARLPSRTRSASAGRRWSTWPTTRRRPRPRRART